MTARLAAGDRSKGWRAFSRVNSLLRRSLRPWPGRNKAKGHMCTSCAWGKPAHPHIFEFCENGAKATIWELTRDRCTPEFFAEHRH